MCRFLDAGMTNPSTRCGGPALSSQLASGLSALAPRSGLERSDFVQWRKAASRRFTDWSVRKDAIPFRRFAQ
jgi:hypothetical protein